jgi:predicted phosphohydrolase
MKLKEEHPEKEIVVFMHFPPYWNGKESENLIALLKEFNITKVFYGHIHGNYTLPQSYTYDGIEMSIVSADYLKFIPKIVK